MPHADPRLDLEPPAASVHAWLFVLVVALPVVVTLVAMGYGMASAGPKRLLGDSETLTWVAVMGGTTGLVSAIWWFMARKLRRHHLVLGATGIDIDTTLYQQSLALADLRLAEARVIDLDEHTEFKPRLKTNGTDLPGLKSGWFRLRNRHKAFVAMTHGPRVLWLPTGKGFDLLLQPRQPQALLDHLRKMATTPRPR